jgi:SpoVK/Ycf46/Vps4 family AAA+-type ATPase
MSNANKQNWEQAYNEGIDALYAKNFQEARTRFSLAIQLCPGRWEPYYARAWANLEQDDSDEKYMDLIEADLSQAIKIGGENCPDASGILGHLYAQANKDREAFKLLLQAVGRCSLTTEIEKDLVEVLARLLNEFENGDNPGASIKECDRLEDLIRSASLPKSIYGELTAEVHSTRAFCYQKTGEFDKSTAELRQLSQLVPDHPRLPEELTNPRIEIDRGDSKAVSEPTFDDIGGRTVKGTYQAKMCGLFETYFSDSDIETIRKRLDNYGQTPTRFILLFGPSGCGKTYLIRAFSGEYWKRYNKELPINYLRLNEVMDKWVGESEKILTRIFEESVNTQPSILFADEVDALGGSRDTGQDWRVHQTAHLLQELDRLQTQGAFILFFGCTNRIWSVDLALLRRFDQVIPVELPDEEVRIKIFNVHLNKLSPNLRPKELDIDKIKKGSHGLTPGDIEKVVRLSVDMLLAKHSSGLHDQPLSNEEVLKALRQYRQPMHVKEWVRLSIEALTNAGHTDMVEEVNKVYGPYIDSPPASIQPELGPIPSESWIEEQDYDLNIFRPRREETE